MVLSVAYEQGAIGSQRGYGKQAWKTFKRTFKKIIDLNTNMIKESIVSYFGIFEQIFCDTPEVIATFKIK